VASTHQVDIFDVPEDRKFKAAVAYYPLCSVAAEELSIPTLIMVGELDDWTPAKYCDMWMKTRSGRGAPAKLIVYPGAYHALMFRASSMVRERSGTGSNTTRMRRGVQSRKCRNSFLPSCHTRLRTNGRDIASTAHLACPG
jgi:dienelactone hydrolase